MGRRTNISVLNPSVTGMNYGNRPYMSNKSYGAQMRKLTNIAVVNAGGTFPESEFTRPYAQDVDSYDELEYWFPMPFDFDLGWELYPPEQLDALGDIPYVELPEIELPEPKLLTTSVWPTAATGPSKWVSGSVSKLSQPTWAVAHDAVMGDGFSNAACNFGVLVDITVPDYSISRGFLYFDLSALSGTVVAVQLDGSWTAVGSSTYSVSEGTQGAPMGTPDYDSFNSTQFGSIVNPSGQQLLEFNSSGISFIQNALGGAAKLCLRENTYDVADSDPGATVNKSISLAIAGSGQSNVHLHVKTQV